ncbi:hypothetical protein GA0115255_109881, partial [Streptomyces sp. Ncost-T6T-2b]
MSSTSGFGGEDGTEKDSSDSVPDGVD